MILTEQKINARYENETTFFIDSKKIVIINGIVSFGRIQSRVDKFYSLLKFLENEGIVYFQNGQKNSIDKEYQVLVYFSLKSK